MDRTFFEIFSSLEDPRNDKSKKYPLMDVIILAIYGTLIGFEDFTNMSYYLKKRESELTEQLDLTAGVPSHDVFSDVFRALDVERFIENLALLRKIAFNFANLDDRMKGKSIKKKMIDYMIDLDLFNRLIYEIVPNRA